MMQQTYFPTFVFACSKSTSLRRKTTLQLFVWAHSASIVILQTGTSKSMLFSAKRKSVYTYYEWARSMDNSLDSLDHLFHSLIIPLFTYGILVWGVASYDKYLSKIGKFQGRVFRFGFIKGAPAHFKPSRAKGLRQEFMDWRASQILLRAFWQISSHPVKQDCQIVAIRMYFLLN